MYQEWLGRHGIRTLLPPDDAHQAQVMAAIRAVKAGPASAARGGASDALAAAAAGLVARGAQAVVAGCTEMPLGLAPDRVGVPLVDP
ncbi:aspartate/glutamate racemase family protein, partial [Streptomyces sp. CHA15]|uniref:aspartate/glutamate racemase family protein n=1 Tax=Streptomyces sp. CHA15 TaxID=2841668 RepID=UPI0027E4D970